MLKAEARQLPWQHLATLVLLTAAVIVSDLGKGRVPCAGGAYWAIALSLVSSVAEHCDRAPASKGRSGGGLRVRTTLITSIDMEPKA